MHKGDKMRNAAVALAFITGLLAALTSVSSAQSYLWSQSFGGTSEDAAMGVAVDGSGNIVMVGYFMGTVDFGGGPLTSGLSDIVLASYDENGSHNWSQNFGGMTGDGRGFAVAVDPNDNIVITGYFFGSVDFGGGPLVANESEDIFVAKFDNNGNHLWSHGYGGTSNIDEGLDIAVDPEGNVVVTGWFADTLDFGAGPITVAGSYDIFLLKLDPDGNHIWSFAYGDSVDTVLEMGRGVATDRDGNIAIIGVFDSEIDFGAGPLVSAGDQDVYLAKLGPDGSPQWNHRFGSTSSERGNAVDFDTEGAIVATGVFAATVDFGGGPLTPPPPSSQVFLIKYTSDGSHMWSQQTGGIGAAEPFDIEIDEDDDSILMSGWFTGTIDFGGGTLSEAGGSAYGDIFIASYTHYGAHRWSDAFGDTLTDYGRDVAVAPGNDVVMAGAFNLSVDFGGGPHASAGNYDAFLVKIEGPVTSGIHNTAPASAATLGQNLPNPFGSRTVIPFTLDRSTEVSLVVYDVAGRHVVTLLSEELPAATHASVWNGRDASGRKVPSGIYFYRLSTGAETLTRKAILIR